MCALAASRRAFFATGVVQGVGFRPFIYTLARKYNLGGFVQNRTEGVAIEVEGEEAALEAFAAALKNELPPLARLDTLTCQEQKGVGEREFRILPSLEGANKTTLIAPDVATCQECLEDMRREGRYKNYFAINCTRCGPRYTIIQTLPYDRKNTSMAPFGMCSACQAEYDDPTNRRYHAQPTACNVCGPKLSLFAIPSSQELHHEDCIRFCAEQIKAGKILAIKGTGGFHLVCDATNKQALERLRECKNRPAKPFALMCKNLEHIEGFAWVNSAEKELLLSKENPIVIVDKKNTAHAKICDLVAPKLGKIGCMLPTTALHHLLFDFLDAPIVATSANLGGEPIIATKEKITEKLGFVDYILDYNREILNALDDSLVQVSAGAMQMLRLGRGYAPFVLKLAQPSKQKILALGAHTKNSLALVHGDSLILSGHIGDLESLESFEFFLRTKESFARFYDFMPELLLHDNHPEYLTTKWAREQPLACAGVGHHLAHVYATKAEWGLEGSYLSFSFDGSGYGDDATVWGGEVFVGDERRYRLKPLKLLGGAKAIKEPRRVALALLLEKLSLEEIRKSGLACAKSFTNQELQMLAKGFEQNINAPLSSSAGRLFDAVASFAGLAQTLSYEGESGLLCEAAYDASVGEHLCFSVENAEIEIKLAEYVCSKDFEAKKLPSLFMNTLVALIVTLASQEKKQVILCGGVFQNKTLVELLAWRFKEENIAWYLQRKTPTNDGGIALGQAAYYLATSF